MSYPQVRLRKGHDNRVRNGHLWIFSNELENGFQSCPPGSPVQVHDVENRLLGTGLINPHSLLTVRMISRGAVLFDQDFIRSKIEAAWSERKKILGDDVTACRIIYSEADGLPGLMLDKFGDVIAIQSLTAAMENVHSIIVNLIIEQFNPRAIVAANDAAVRAWEGLPQERKLLHGTLTEPHPFTQDGITLIADCLEGQKTGFFCDQRFNRLKFASFIKPGMRVLDLFSYTGPFGLYALNSGAEHVTFVDGSQRALDIVQNACTLNNVANRCTTVKTDIFDWVKNPPELFDAVSVDPPALAKSRDKATAALRGYRDLNARALHCVKPGGIFATSSCSGLISAVNWREMLNEAAYKSRRRVRFIHFASQAPDHPILPAMSETEYLKFAVAVVD